MLYAALPIHFLASLFAMMCLSSCPSGCGQPPSLTRRAAAAAAAEAEVSGGGVLAAPLAAVAAAAQTSRMTCPPRFLGGRMILHSKQQQHVKAELVRLNQAAALVQAHSSCIESGRLW
jgi:hypothetical protein